MSAETDIIAALAGVAGGRIYPHAAPENVVKPFVVYRSQRSPITLLSGVVIGATTTITLDCWGETYASAVSTASAVHAAIAASGLHAVASEPPGDGYDPNSDEFVRPLTYRLTQ